VEVNFHEDESCEHWTPENPTPPGPAKHGPMGLTARCSDERVQRVIKALQAKTDAIIFEQAEGR
jgi:hypothetical protein